VVEGWRVSVPKSAGGSAHPCTCRDWSCRVFMAHGPTYNGYSSPHLLFNSHRIRSLATPPTRTTPRTVSSSPYPINHDFFRSNNHLSTVQPSHTHSAHPRISNTRSQIRRPEQAERCLRQPPIPHYRDGSFRDHHCQLSKLLSSNGFSRRTTCSKRRQYWTACQLKKRER
jgi:hypothetical protein